MSDDLRNFQKTISIPDQANTTLSETSKNLDGPQMPGEDDTHYEPKKSKRPTRSLFGILGVSGRPWITVNMGLLLITCKCGEKDGIDSRKTFYEFQENVDAFSNRHATCGRE